MVKILKKLSIDKTVLEVARQRFHQLFANFDTVVISFSGGKDSTVCLNLGLEVARELGKLPLKVYHWDEEAIWPETIDYVSRVANHPDIDFKWLCLPIKHRNACSRKEPYWHPWDPDKKDLWVREMPPGAITELKGFRKGMTVVDCAHIVYGPEHGTVADVRGLRADESLRRYRAVSSREKDNWIGLARDGYSFPVSPIYDWTTKDVWLASMTLGWDYNTTYDTFALMGIPWNSQRVCPPFGEEPLRSLAIYAEGWPEMWDKMIKRVHGAATAARYSRTEIYGFNGLVLPSGFTWQQYTVSLIKMYPAQIKATVAKNVNALINAHKSKTQRRITQEIPDPLTGICWKNLAEVASRADLKQRRAGMMTTKAESTRKNLGIEEIFQSMSEAQISERFDQYCKQKERAKNEI